MMLVEETQIPEAALPVTPLRHHLRLGTGFAEDDVQDGVLGSFLRAAMAAIEARTSKILVERSFVLTLNAWRPEGHASLPVAPVTAVTQLALVDQWGAVTTVSPDRYRLLADMDRPRIVSRSAALPQISGGGAVEIRFSAGLATGFDDLPADLMQALLLLAAHYYEYRDDTSLGQGCMPFGVTSLLARYRPVRLGAAQ